MPNINRFIFILLFLGFEFSIFGGKLTLQVKKPNHSLVLRKKKNIAEYHPNSSLHWGVKYLGDAFYIEYGQKIPGSNYNNSSVGNDSYKDYKLGIYSSNFYYEVFYKEYIGFSSNEEDKSKSCDLCSNRENLTSREFNFSTYWAVNSNFSMSALTSSGYGGVKSSSSLILNLVLNRLKIRDPAGIVQNDKVSELSTFAEATSIEMKLAGVGFGYGQIYDLAKIFYLALYGGVGAGYQEYSINGPDINSSGTGMAGHWGVRFNLGTQTKSLNIGFKGLLYSNIYDLGSNLNAASVNYSLYAYIVVPI